MKVEIKVPESMIDRLDDKFNVYSYNDNIFNLIAKDISLNDGKVTFYVRRLGYYVLTKDKIDQGVYDDIALIKDNAKLNKEEKKNYTPLIVGLVLICASILGGLSYFICKKKTTKKKKKTTKKKSKK